MHTQLRSRYGVLIGEPDIYRGWNETLYVGGHWRDPRGTTYANVPGSEVTVEVAS